jgi:hypothetical protein
MRGIQPARPPSPLDAELAMEFCCRWPSALGFPTLAATALACPGPLAAVRRLSGIIRSNDGLLASCSFGTLAANGPGAALHPSNSSPRSGQLAAEQPAGAMSGSDQFARIGAMLLTIAPQPLGSMRHRTPVRCSAFD